MSGGFFPDSQPSSGQMARISFSSPLPVADQRREPDPDKRLEDDDVTLLRVRMLPGQPSLLLACR